MFFRKPELCWWIIVIIKMIILCFLLITSASGHKFFEDANLRWLNFEKIPPTITYAITKSTLKIPCIPEEIQQVSLQWNKDNRPFYSPRFSQRDGHLFLSNVNKDDSGQYRCLLTDSNNYTVASHSVTVVVKKPEEFWQTALLNMSVVEGSTIRLACPVSIPEGPSPYGYELSWTKDNQDIFSTNRIIVQNNGVLIIRKSSSIDSGSYRCKATFEDVSVQSTPSVLDFIRENKFKYQEECRCLLRPPLPFTFLESPQVVKAIENKSAYLECISNENDLSSHKWTRKDKEPISQDAAVTQGGSLHLHRVTQDDKDLYYCSSKNIEKKRIVRLVVLRPPIILFKKVQKVKPVHAMFNCTATGVPLPNIEILKDGVAIKKKFNYDILGPNKTSTPNTVTQALHISYIWEADSGLYQCIAKNKAGVASEAVILKVDVNKYLPRLQVKTTNISYNTITFEWSFTSDVDLSSFQTQNFILTFFSAGEEEKHTESLVDAYMEKYSHLMPDTKYTFIIRPMFVESNSIKTSNPEFVYVKTLGYSPVASPKLKLEHLKDRIRVKWSLLNIYESGGPIVQQKIQWKKENSLDIKQETLLPNTTKYLIEGIDKNTNYQIRVLVKSSSGYSERSSKWKNVPSYRASRKSSSIGNEYHSMHRSQLGLCLHTNSESSIKVTWDYLDGMKNSKAVITVKKYHGETKVIYEDAASRGYYITKLDEGCYTVNVRVQNSPNMEDTAYICTVQPYNQSYSTSTVKDLSVMYVKSDEIYIKWKALNYKLQDYFIVRMRKLNTQYSHHYVDSSQEEYNYTGSYENYDNYSNMSNFDTNITENYEDITESSQAEGFFLLVSCPEADLHYLTSETEYMLQVITANFYSKSLPSEAIHVKTKPKATSPPIHFNKVFLSTSSVRVSWSNPMHSSKPIKKFEISYSNDDSAWKSIEVDKKLNSVELRGLVSNTEYNVRISAKTDIGRGEALTGRFIIPAELRRGISKEMIVLYVASALVVVTCIVLIHLCRKMYILRKDRRSVDGELPSPTRVMYVNDSNNRHNEQYNLIQGNPHPTKHPSSQQPQRHYPRYRRDVDIRGVNNEESASFLNNDRKEDVAANNHDK